MTSNKFNLEFKGLLSSPASWAKVSRKLLVNLAEREEISLKIQPTRGFLWSDEFPLPDKLEKLTGSQPEADCRLTFAYPPQLKNYKSETTAPLWNLSVYEASRLPPDWAEPLNSFCERVLVPSTHAKETYLRSGVEEGKVAVVPYGYDKLLVDRQLKLLEGRGGDNIKIVTVATPHHRKGLDIVARCSDILKKSNLHWHVHAPYRPGEKTEFWEDSGILQRLQEKGFTVTDKPVKDEKIIRLLGSADLCVQPSRSEGFGLVILEAMAAQTPVVTSNWGGQLDFKGPGMITVGGELRKAKHCQYDSHHPEAKVFEPDLRGLKKELQNLVDNPGKLQKLGTKARATVKQLTWKNSARELLELIRSCHN